MQQIVLAQIVFHEQPVHAVCHTVENKTTRTNVHSRSSATSTQQKGLQCRVGHAVQNARQEPAHLKVAAIAVNNGLVELQSTKVKKSAPTKRSTRTSGARLGSLHFNQANILEMELEVDLCKRFKMYSLWVAFASYVKSS